QHHILTSSFFLFNATAPTHLYTLSLHDALPICTSHLGRRTRRSSLPLPAQAPDPERPSMEPRAPRLGREEAREEEEEPPSTAQRSEEHTSELQSRGHLVCRLLLEKKKTKKETEP